MAKTPRTTTVQRINEAPGVHLSEDQRDALALRMEGSGLPRKGKVTLGDDTFRVSCKRYKVIVEAVKVVD